MKRLFGALLAAVLLLQAPGLPAYQAWAAGVHRAPHGAPVSVGGARPTRLPPSVVRDAERGLDEAGPVSVDLSVAVPVSEAAAPTHRPRLSDAPSAGAAAARGFLGSAAVSAPAGAVRGAELDAANGRALFDLQPARRGGDAYAPQGHDSQPAPLPAPSAGEPKDGAPVPAPSGDGKAKLPRSIWGLFWGHHIFIVFGINIHIIAQPFLVKDAMGMGTTTMGLMRNIHLGAMALVNMLPIGYLIDKTDYRAVFIATSLVRALMMAAIPLMFSAGYLSFTVLAVIVAVNPIFQTAMIVADGAARKSILGKDEKMNKEATATINKWDALAGMLMPLAAGWLLGVLFSQFGLGGYAWGYAVYAAFVLAAIPFFWTMVRDPRFPENDTIGVLKFSGQVLKFMGALTLSLFTPVLGILRWSASKVWKQKKDAPVTALWLAGESARLLVGALLLPLTVPFVLLKGLLAAARFGAAALKGRGAASDGKSTVQRLRELAADRVEPITSMQGLAFILRNKILSVLTAVMALEVFLIDALPFVLLPNFVTDALGAAPAALPISPESLLLAASVAGAAALIAAIVKLARKTGWMPTLTFGVLAAGLAGVAVWPSLLMIQVATAGGIMGLMLSAEYVGKFITSARLEGDKGDRLIDKVGHGFFYKAAAVASLAFWALLIPVYLTPGMFWLNLAILGGVLMIVQLFHAAVPIVIEPVKRREMDDDKLARIESAVFMVDVAFESVGALMLGIVIDVWGIGAGLIVTAVFFSLASILQWKVPGWIFPDGKRPAKSPAN